jgi:hypothetical protein
LTKKHDITFGESRRRFRNSVARLSARFVTTEARPLTANTDFRAAESLVDMAQYHLGVMLIWG